jgi:hypothetical protein
VRNRHRLRDLEHLPRKRLCQTAREFLRRRFTSIGALRVVADVLTEICRSGRILIRHVLQVPADVSELIGHRLGRLWHRTVGLPAPGQRNCDNQHQHASNLS